MLEDKDIIQVDATMIAGLIILLTISSIAGNTKSIIVKNAIGYVVTSILPFAISALLITSQNLRSPRPLNSQSINSQSKPKDEFRFVRMMSLSFTATGFVWFVIVAAYFLYISFSNG